MKKYLLFGLSLFVFKMDSLAQICANDTNSREFVMPIFENLEGYHSSLQLDPPGLTTVAKADTFLNLLISEYSTQLNDKEITRTGIYSSISSSLVEYHQHSNGVRIKGRRILLMMDSEDIIRSFDLFLVLDNEDIDTIQDLTDTVTEPEKYYITKNNGKWVIEAYYEPLDPQLVCDDDVNVHIWIGFPEHTCCTTSEDVTVGNSSLSFLKSGDDANDGLCGVYANLPSNLVPEDPFNQNEPFLDECLESGNYPPTGSGTLQRPLYETIMCYYHLNSAFQNIDSELSDASVSAGMEPFDFRKDILFDPFVNSSLASNISVDYQSNPPKISFKGLDDGLSDCPLDFNDYAEDADFICETAFELMIHDKFIYPKFGTNEGLGNGTVSFLTWHLMSLNGFDHNAIGDYGGRQDLLPENPVFVNSNSSYGDLGNNAARVNASIWATTLKKTYDIFKNEDIEELFWPLLMKIMKQWNETTTQYKSAVLFYNELNMLYRMPGSELTHSAFCEISEILYSKYAVGRIDDSKDPEFEFADLYVKDTKEVTTGLITPEDIGNEANDESAYFDYSPSVWNCHNQTCTSNVLPAINTDNYLRVAVTNRDQGCIWAGKIELYVNLSSTLDYWPTHWGGDIDGDGNTDDYYLSINGVNYLIAKKVGEIDMAEDTYEGDDDERIYTKEWEPWNPDPQNKNKYFKNKVQQGFLARIVSPYDIITTEEHGLTVNYVKKNNNVAQRKQNTIVYGGGPFVITDEPVMIRPKPFAGPSYPVTLVTDFNLPSYVNTHNFDTLGSVKLLFPPSLVDLFDVTAPHGSGFQWVNDSIISVTNPNFEFSMVLDSGQAYPILLLYQGGRGFIPFSFKLSQLNDDECYEGGQYFSVTQYGITPRSESEESYTNGLIVIPNPTRDNIVIHFEDIEVMHGVEVFNLTGELIYSTNKTQSEYNISTLLWPEGYYIARIQKADGSLKTTSFIRLKN
jgi:hypothetical protein